MCKMIGQSLFGDIFNMIDCSIQSKIIDKQNIKKMIHYKPESFDTTVVRPRIKFEKIDENMPFFKNTMINDNKE